MCRATGWVWIIRKPFGYELNKIKQLFITGNRPKVQPFAAFSGCVSIQSFNHRKYSTQLAVNKILNRINSSIVGTNDFPGGKIGMISPEKFYYV
jgi:hypothetical protein